MRRSCLIRRTIMLVIVLGAVSGGLYYLQHMDSTPQAMQARGPQTLPVGMVTLTARTVPMQPLYLGQAEASQTVEIRARVNGFLESRHFEEGGAVEEGQLLFRIDPRSFGADLDLAKAQLASAQAEYAQAEKKVDRYTRLRKSGSTTQDELDQWRTAQLVAQANIMMARARIVKADLDLGYTSITSPITGHIGMAQKDVGSYVDGSTGGLLAVVEKTDPIYVRYTVSEQDILQARRMAASGRTNQPLVDQITLSLTLADGAPYPLKGKISYTDPQIDPSTSSSVMRGTFPNPGGQLRPGQFVHVRVDGINRLNALLVPKSAVIQNPTGAFVYVVGEGDKAELRPVKLGEWQAGQWVVEDGLKPGETVITDHLMQVRPGMAVTRAPEAKPQAAGTSEG
ncbi:efflux RND transporter periplasmic adaptor subunit [Pseudodesulfovibrio sp.]|uniref:efflux RND transporter periplasmic adaptor subunit n=1 Tax=Pseudodesulfovibrio sp. TaxID=2035812 RepID=UPI002620B09F|nr:efflux RND transporter periplasmic adaptor subunit [Pseudodesulfovibrio sp.]MDD3311419.1 efflux RND transporter periplasmic adaptor subunit [Pseudodesulfovibrio sp.]